MTAEPPIGVVAGSGLCLTGLLDAELRTLPFPENSAAPQQTIPGHRGRFVLGTCGNRTVVLQEGRLHAYEGFGVQELGAPTAVLHNLGVQTIIFTNAAGGLRPEMRPGDLLSVNALLAWPYHRFELPEKQYPDISIPGCDSSGVYVWMHGPCYETRAEIKTLQRLGGAAVGMSAAPEMVHCRKLGIQCALISCITNNCCAPQVLTHPHVLQTAARASRRLTSVIRNAIMSLR